MSSKPPLTIQNLLFILLILLVSITVCPVNSRPSSSFDRPHPHHVHHKGTDLMPRQSEPMTNENEDQLLTDTKSEEHEFQEEAEEEEEEDNEASDVPTLADDNLDNNGARKGEVRHSKSHHNTRNGRRISSEQPAIVNSAPEGNDTFAVVQEDLNLEPNKTLDDSNGSNTTTNDENYIQLSKNNRERNKVLRLNEIKEMVQNYLRQPPTAVEPSKPTDIPGELLEKFNLSQSPPLDSYPMKRRSFHPSCNLPNNTDIELWTDDSSMNLLFNLTYPIQQNTSITVIAATLRLFKYSQGNHTVVEQSCNPSVVSPTTTDPEDDDEIQEPQQDNPVLPETLLLPSPAGTVNIADDDKQIRVSVYWYTRSLKRNKVKRKLLDSRMLPIYGKGEWIEFNVRYAVRQWRQLGKNFGLVVEVENEDGEVQKASNYFTAMNCSNEASTARPLPGVLLQAAQNYMESNFPSTGTGFDLSSIITRGTGFPIFNNNHNSRSNNSPGYGGGRKRDTSFRDENAPRRITNSPYIYSFLFPVIDMCTVEVPAQEASNAAFLHHAQYVLTQHMAACKNRNKPNHTDLMFTHGVQTQPIHTQVISTAMESNETGTLDTISEIGNSNINNITFVEHEAHKDHHEAHLALPDEIFPSIEARPARIRHLRRHLEERHKHRNQETHKRHASKGEDNRESEEIKEQITWTDENGDEFREKIIIQEKIHSANPHNSNPLPQRESDR